MNFSTPEEGRKLINAIQYEIKKIEEQEKYDEIEKHFVKQNIYDLRVRDTCYLAIYIPNGKGGIVKVKLEKRSHDEFYFVGLENDFVNYSNKIKEWTIVNRPNHPYAVKSQMDISRYIEPNPYSDVDNIRTVEILQPRQLKA